MLRSLLSFLMIAAVVLPRITSAQNPEQVNLRARMIGSETETRLLRNIRVRVSHNFDAPLAEGTSCDVTLSACPQVFIPRRLRPNRTRGRCNPVEIASVNMTTGQERAFFRMAGPPLVVRRPGRARQISFQTQSNCVDIENNEATLHSPPRARKSSRRDRIGHTPRRVFRVFSRRMRIVAR